MEANKEPNLIDKAKSLGGAVTNWATKDGFAKVSEQQFQMRKSLCVACPHWDATAFGNTGKCTKCGCSVMKLYIPSARCPDSPPKWDVISVS